MLPAIFQYTADALEDLFVEALFPIPFASPHLGLVDAYKNMAQI
jgi:hypothetical protein